MDVFVFFFQNCHEYTSTYSFLYILLLQDIPLSFKTQSYGFKDTSHIGISRVTLDLYLRNLFQAVIHQDKMYPVSATPLFNKYKKRVHLPGHTYYICKGDIINIEVL